MPVGYRFYWDSDCRFCNRLRQFGGALDWSGAVSFVPLNSEAAEIDLGHLTPEEMMASSHLVDPMGRVYSRGEGILELARLLPLCAPLAFVFCLLPNHRALADRLYGWVSRHRGVPYGGSCKVDFSSARDPQPHD